MGFWLEVTTPQAKGAWPATQVQVEVVFQQVEHSAIRVPLT
jgi:hypothetical protein